MGARRRSGRGRPLRALVFVVLGLIALLVTGALVAGGGPRSPAPPPAVPLSPAAIANQWSEAMAQEATASFQAEAVARAWGAGTIDTPAAAARYADLDRTAASVATWVDTLPPVPGADPTPFRQYRAATDAWSRGLHTVAGGIARGDTATILAGVRSVQQADALERSASAGLQALLPPASP